MEPPRFISVKPTNPENYIMSKLKSGFEIPEHVESLARVASFLREVKD
jgi:hypothetical protein